MLQNLIFIALIPLAASLGFWLWIKPIVMQLKNAKTETQKRDIISDITIGKTRIFYSLLFSILAIGAYMATEHLPTLLKDGLNRSHLDGSFLTGLLLLFTFMLLAYMNNNICNMIIKAARKL